MARYNAYRWRYELNLVKKIGLALAVAGAAIARGITPKQAYNGETDAGKWANWRLP